MRSLDPKLPYLTKQQAATAPLLGITLLIAGACAFTLDFPVAAQGIAPTATPTPSAISPPIPTPAFTTASFADGEGQPSGLFSAVEGDPPPSPDVETLASRLVRIEFGQLARVTESPDDAKGPTTGEPLPPQTLALNLFDDVVFTGIVEHIEPTSSGYALWGRLEGVELGTMTLVANGRVVVGTVRTPDAVYTIRTAGDGTYVISQIDESSLPPPGEPLIGSSSAPEAQPPVPQQRTGQIEVLAPTATSTSPPPTPVSTVPSQPSEVDDEAKLGGLFLEVEGDPPPSPDVETLASRLVQIDFGQLARVTESPDDAKDSATGEPSPPQTLMLNLFDDVVFTGIVEHIEPTSSGYALWGRLEGVELGNITLVVNGRVVVGTVRTPKAVYTIRTAGDGTYVIRQIDESSLPPPGDPLTGSSSAPDAQPLVPQQGTVPTATTTPVIMSPPPTPVSTVPSQPSDVDDDEAKRSGLFSEVEGDPPPSSGVETLATRLVGIDFGQLARVTEPPDDAKGPATGNLRRLRRLF